MLPWQRELLRALGPEIVFFSPAHLSAYAYDATGERYSPEAVALPSTAGEVAAAVRIAARYGVPVVARGAGSNLSGGTLPVAGGLVLGLSRLNRILSVDPASRLAVVQPGVVNHDLQETLRRQGFFYAPDPASFRVSTLGGNVAENAGGPRCLRYGVTADHVRGARVIQGDGREVALDEGNGYDLIGLLIGSEGTFAVITELTLSILPLPGEVRTFLASFSDAGAAGRAAGDLLAVGLVPGSLEFMDGKLVALVERTLGVGYPVGAGAVLLLDLEGTPESLDAQEEAALAVLGRAGAVEIRRAGTNAEREALWRGRRAAFSCLGGFGKRIWTEDVTVPRREVARLLEAVEEIAARHRLRVYTMAHAGDGNMHPNLLYAPEDADEVERLHLADREILRAGVEMGGTITGEHGVGWEKRENLRMQTSAAELALLERLKRAWDPAGGLNPGKAYPQVGEARPGEVAEAFRDVFRQGKKVFVKGGGTKGVSPPPDAVIIATGSFSRILEVDEENLTATVEGGCPAAALEGLSARFRTPLGEGAAGGATVGGELSAWGMDPFGPRAWRGGLSRSLVSGLEAVLPTGEVVRAGGKTMKNVAGYNWLPLFLGAWGTLGVITKVVLRLVPRPATSLTLEAVFPEGEAVIRGSLDVVASGEEPERLRLFAGRGEAGLLLGLEGYPEDVAARARRLEEILRGSGAQVRRIAAENEEDWQGPPRRGAMVRLPADRLSVLARELDQEFRLLGAPLPGHLLLEGDDWEGRAAGLVETLGGRLSAWPTFPGDDHLSRAVRAAFDPAAVLYFPGREGER